MVTGAEAEARVPARKNTRLKKILALPSDRQNPWYPGMKLVPKVVLSLDNTSGLTSDTRELVESERRPGGLTAALIIRALTGTAPSITGKIQHSPSPMTVSEANAVWKDLLTFAAQTAVGGDVQQIATPYFPRLRAQVTRGGTAVTQLSYDVVIS